jgi:hypothetical protein
MLLAVVLVLILFSLADAAQLRPSSTAPASRGNNAVATIASKNHLFKVRAFFDAVKQHNPDVEKHLLLVDAVDGMFAPTAEQFHVTTVDKLPTLTSDEINDMLRKYSVMEANNNFKGAFLMHLLESKHIDKILLFDPDEYIVSSLSPLFDALNGDCSIVTTPHAVAPIPTNEYPINDLAFLNVGTLNLGFIGVRSGARTTSFLNWWQRKLQHEGFYREEKAMFSDQKWMDLAFSYFGDIHCTQRNQTLNVAYWNLHERGHLIKHDRRRYYVGDAPMMFFHFSAWDIDTDPRHISRYTSLRYSLDDVPQLRPLYSVYRRLVAYHLNRQDTRQWPYAFKAEA